MSIVLFSLACLDLFNESAFLVIFSLLLCYYLFKKRFSGDTIKTFLYYLIFIFALACITQLTGFLIKPRAALLNSTDGSIYIGTAFNLANRGNIRHYDAVVREMAKEEREVFFKNRFQSDNTGKYARFPGGVPVVDISSGAVSFRFAPMLSVWLGFGLKVLGDREFLNVLVLFSSVSLISLFLLARYFGGNLLGFCIASMHLSFFPQLYYSGFPSSELLTQALFLSGLWVSFLGFLKDDFASIACRRLTALLWGVMFFCRIDALMFVPLSLILIFLVSPLYRKMISAHGFTFVSWLFFFFLAAFFYQLTGGTYQNVISHFLHLDLSTLERVNDFLNNGYRLSLQVAVTVAIGLSFLLNKLLKAQCYNSLILTGRITLFLALTAGLSFFVLRFDYAKLLKHIGWITLYLPDGLLLLLLPGGLLSFSVVNRKAGRSAALIVFLFCATPAFCYLVDPLVTPMQPWAIRRFVPMIFPLFFLLTMSGWFLFLRWVFNNYAGKYRITFVPFFCLFTALFVISFWNKSSFLTSRSFFENIVTELKETGKNIPGSGSLVIIPDSQASMHMQIPLQYMTRHDALLLTLGSKSTDEGVSEKIVNNYLERQLSQGRRVILMLDGKNNNFSYPARDFSLKYITEKNISFNYIPQVRQDRFPDRISELSVNYILFELQKRENLPAKDFMIDIGVQQEDIPFILKGFYGPESEQSRSYKTFRWTGPEASIIIPPVRSIKLSINPSRPLGAEPTNLTVQADRAEAAKFDSIPSDRNALCVNIPDEVRQRGEWVELTLKSEPFSPKTLGLSEDNRDLGIALYKVSIGCE